MGRRPGEQIGKEERRRGLRTRNAGAARGAALTVKEVLEHAKPGHFACRAREGKPAGIVRTAGAMTYCKCATAGLIKAHPEVIIDESGAAYWPAPDED